MYDYIHSTNTNTEPICWHFKQIKEESKIILFIYLFIDAIKLALRQTLRKSLLISLYSFFLANVASSMFLFSLLRKFGSVLFRFVLHWYHFQFVYLVSECFFVYDFLLHVFAFQLYFLVSTILLIINSYRCFLHATVKTIYQCYLKPKIVKLSLVMLVLMLLNG